MTIQRVGILGSGIMGSGIAEVAAKAGIDVVLRSREQETADAMREGLAKSLAKQVSREKIQQADSDAVFSRVSATDHLGDLVDCDLVIESVVEDLGIKVSLFAELDSICKPEAILATSTDPLGNTTNFVSDSMGRITETTSPLGHVSSVSGEASHSP